MHIILYLLFLGALLLNGLYFYEHANIFFMMLAIIACLIWCYELVKGNLMQLPTLLLPLPLLYVIPLLTNRESVQGTLNQMLVFTSFIFFYFILMRIKQEKNGIHKLKRVMTGISWSTVVLSLLVLVSVFPYPHFVMSVSKDVSGLGERLGGFLQYPNAMATLFAAMLLFHLIHSAIEDKIAGYLQQSLILPVLITFLLLTESRGAWLCFLLVWVITISFFERSKQIRFLTISFLSFLLGALIYIVIIQSGTIYMNVLSIIATIILSAGMYLIKPGHFMQKEIVGKLSFLVKNKFQLPTMIALIIVLGALDIIYQGLFYRMLPEALQNRFSFGLGTLNDRFYYWKDVWDHLSSFTLTGIGGDGWATFMYRVQTFPYLTSELHNGFLNLFLELGIIGFGYILFLLIFAGRRILKGNVVIFPVFLLILLHGMIDFSFSYPVVILWLLLIISLTPEKVTEENKLKKWLGQSSFIVILIGSVILGSKFLMAERSFQEALVASTKEEAVWKVSEAIQSNRSNANYVVFAVQNELLSNEEAEPLLKQTLKFEPNHSLIQFLLANQLAEQGKMDQAVMFYELALKNDRFDINKYEWINKQYLEESQLAFQSGDSERGELFKEKANRIYRSAEKLANSVEKASKDRQNQREFYVSEEFRELNK